MNLEKKYPHLPDEDNRLRKVCNASLIAEYGKIQDLSVIERMEKELSAIADFGLSGIFLILRELVIKAGLKRFEIANRGTFGASFVAWLCGLTPFNPLKTVLPLYPEFNFGLYWNRELSIEIIVPDGKVEPLYETLKTIEGVGDVAPLLSETEHSITFGRCIIPVGEKAEPTQCIKNNNPYFELIITTLTHLRLLERCVELTGTDPEHISLDDKDVWELFTHTDHPACIEISPYRLSAIGLFGIRDFHTLALYSNVNISLQSFADLVRIEALMHSAGTWNDNQENLVYEQGVRMASLITCREDVYEYCRFHLGMNHEDSFTVAERVRKGCGVPDNLEEKAPSEKHSKLKQFKAVCDRISYLHSRVHCYGYMVIAWRCAWYRLHYPVEFYQAYFEIVANPKIARAVFSGRNSYIRLTVYRPNLEDQEFDMKFDYDVDLAVADEMYFRGIDLSNARTGIDSPNGVIHVHDILQPGQVTVLAGRPRVGKTSLACDVVNAFSTFEEGVPVYISLETSAEKISDLLSKRENSRCLIFDTVDESLSNVTAHLRELDVDVSIIVLDYVQLLQVSDMKKTLVILRNLAEDFSAPVLIISQLPRSIDERDDKRPKLSDLPMANSLGLIDNVIFLYREDYYTGENTGAAEAIIAKAKASEGEEIIRLSWDAVQDFYNMN